MSDTIPVISIKTFKDNRRKKEEFESIFKMRVVVVEAFLLSEKNNKRRM
jgi:hypothetical protein